MESNLRNLDTDGTTTANCILKRAVRKLNDAIRILKPWFNKWRIKINVNKCSTTLFSKRRSHIRYAPSPLKIFYTNINWTSEINYLGVILDSKLIYRAHINRSFCKTNLRLRQLHPILIKASHFHQHLRNRILHNLDLSSSTFRVIHFHSLHPLNSGVCTKPASSCPSGHG
jgi:hypothetical protein